VVCPHSDLDPEAFDHGHEEVDNVRDELAEVIADERARHTPVSMWL
jgi:hypothetical protein